MSTSSSFFKWLYYSSTMAVAYTACHLYQHDMARINLLLLAKSRTAAPTKTHPYHQLHPHSHHQDQLNSYSSAGVPAYPRLLFTLNLTIVLLIWTHFLYPRRSLALATAAIIGLTAAYRQAVALDYCPLMNSPLMVAALSGLCWALAEAVQAKEEKEEEEVAKKEQEHLATSSTTTSELTSSKVASEPSVAITMSTASSSSNTEASPSN